jgi:hypothetical protein
MHLTKSIRHHWVKVAFKTYKCSKCGCEKTTIADYLYPVYFMYNRMRMELPECKTVYHNDKIETYEKRSKNY